MCVCVGEVEMGLKLRLTSVKEKKVEVEVRMEKVQRQKSLFFLTKHLRYSQGTGIWSSSFSLTTAGLSNIWAAGPNRPAG